MKLDEAIKKRCSTREFSSKKVKWEDILKAIDSANQISFAGNINNLKFLIISNQGKKDSIAKQSQQLWISTAPYVIVICSDSSRLESLYHQRGLVYSRQQAGAAIQNFLLKTNRLKTLKLLGRGLCRRHSKTNSKNSRTLQHRSSPSNRIRKRKTNKKSKTRNQNLLGRLGNQ